MKKAIALFIVAVVVVTGLALALVAGTAAANGQQFRWITHYDQGPNGQIRTWTQCMPDDAWNGHSGHVNRAGVPDDVWGGPCGDSVPTDVPPTNVPPTNVPPTNVPPTNVPPTNVPPTNVPPTQIGDPTNPAPTEVVATEVYVQPTEVPCRGEDRCGGIATSGVNFQPGRVPTIPGTVYVTDAGGLGGKIFFSAHFNAGDQWSGWIDFPLQFGVSGAGLQAWWVVDAGGAPVQLVIINPWISTLMANMLEIDWP